MEQQVKELQRRIEEKDRYIAQAIKSVKKEGVK